MEYETKILSRLKKEGVPLSEGLGQHILIDEEVISLFTNQIRQGGDVLEIGSGPGNLTGRIAERAHRVVGIEIDPKFKPFLDEVRSKHPNVEIIFGNVMTVDLGKIVEGGNGTWQIASNLPFHISKPLLTRTTNLPIEDALIVVGDQLARRMQIDSPDNPGFSRTSLLTQTFFEIEILTGIGKESFYPQPRTDAALVRLYPRDPREIENNPRLAILRNLFLSERKNPTVAKVIKESTGSGERQPTLSKTENLRLERRKSRQEMRQLTRDWQYGVGSEHGGRNSTRGSEVDKLDLPQDILSRPFSSLGNPELRALAAALKRRYGWSSHSRQF